MNPLKIVFQILAKKIYSKEFANLKAKLTNEYRLFMRAKIKPSVIMQQVLISGEDHRFFKHFGFDLIAILRAIYRRIIYSKKEGASTIEQQVVRVITNDFERTIQRKIKEIFLATLVQEIIPKSQIPAFYLSIAYYGWRMNGIKQAYKRLKFNQKSISLDDATEIVARIKYPEPKLLSSEKKIKIIIRKNHLEKLYIKHAKRSIYSKLNNLNVYESISTFRKGQKLSMGVLSPR